MNVHVLPIAWRRGSASPVASRATAARQGCAKVYELEDARKARAVAHPVIPDAVLDEVEVAARLADELHAAGRRLRFGLHDLSGRVVVDLCDLEGAVLRPISLTEAISAPAGHVPDSAA